MTESDIFALVILVPLIITAIAPFIVIGIKFCIYLWKDF